MPALIDYDLPNSGGGGFYEWETEPQLAPDASGFDEVKATICFKGTAAQLMGLFDLGAKNCPEFTSLPMYYAGPRVQEARFGFHIAELTWKGMATTPWASPPVQQLAANAYVRSMNIRMTTTETDWPRGVAGNTIYLLPPYSLAGNVAGKPGIRTFTAIAPNGDIVTTAELPYRCRLVGRAWAVTLSGIVAGERTVITRPPVCTVPSPVATGGGGNQAINWEATGDPLVTWAEDTRGSDGWVCRNYDLSNEQPLGNIMLSRWTAYYEWVLRKGP